MKDLEYKYIHSFGGLVELELAAARPQLACGRSMWPREELHCHSIKM